MQERLIESVLEFTPQGERPTEQRHVGRILEIGKADDAREPMRRAEPVPEVMLLEREHPKAARCEVGGGGAPHAAHAGDDHIVLRNHGINLNGQKISTDTERPVPIHGES